MATPQTNTRATEPQYDGFFIDDHSTENDAADNTNNTSNGDRMIETDSNRDGSNANSSCNDHNTDSICDDPNADSNFDDPNADPNCDDSNTNSNLFQSSETIPLDRETNDTAQSRKTSMANAETPEYDAQESGLKGKPIAAVANESALQAEQKPTLEEEKTTTTDHDKSDEESDFDPDDADIQRDAANDIVALMVHGALAFFALLFILAIVGSMLLVAKYGFITFVLLLLLVGAGISLGYFVMRLMVDEKKFKPTQRKIRRWHAIAKAVVEREVRDFQLDMRDHQMLLTYTDWDGSTQYETEYEEFNDNLETNGKTAQPVKSTTTVGDVDKEQMNETLPEQRRRRGPRSMVFRVVVKPFLKEKPNKRSFFRRKKKQNAASDANTNNGSYVPPANEMV